MKGDIDYEELEASYLKSQMLFYKTNALAFGTTHLHGFTEKKIYAIGYRLVEGISRKIVRLKKYEDGIQNYFEKTNQYPKYYSNEDFSNICDDIKKKWIRVYFLLRGKMKQIFLYLKKNMDTHYLQKLMIILICFLM
ncbi:MAG: hypothetical protein UDR98_05075 [Coprococcus eutactus]|nr:hypothetical protein [Coprococcus eutactus]